MRKGRLLAFRILNFSADYANRDRLDGISSFCNHYIESIDTQIAATFGFFQTHGLCPKEIIHQRIPLIVSKDVFSSLRRASKDPGHHNILS